MRDHPRGPRWTLALVAILALVPAGAMAWESLDGDDTAPHTAWPTVPIAYSLNQNGSSDLGGYTATQTVIAASFASWAAPACTGWETTFSGSTSRRPGNTDGSNVLGWVESGWPFDSSAIGVCSVIYGGTGRIGEADISFNGVHYTWSTTGTGSTVDTQSIATHEMGHFLGLGDLYDGDCSGGQTMCGTYGGGTGPRTLAADDISGVCTIYPSGYGTCTTEGDCPTGHDCVANVCVPAPEGACAPCTDDYDCGDEDDYCLFGYPDGGAYCSTGCTTEADCEWGYDCVELESGIRQCIPSDADCTPPPAPECSVDGDCPTGATCLDQACVSQACAPCTDHLHCGGDDDYCLSGFSDGNTYCGIHCTTTADCDWGYQCVPISGGAPDQCVPNTMDCTPPPVPECASDFDCPEMYSCVEGYCRGKVCAPCTSSAECGGAQDLCLFVFTDGVGHCGKRCSSPTECGWGFMCESWQCVPEDYDCLTIPIPECILTTDCPAGSVCLDGLCVECMEDGDCDPGYVCDATGTCIPDTSPHLPPCAICASNDDCGGADDYCVGGFVDGTSRCGVSCDSVGGVCAAGYEWYEDLGGIPSQCLPSTMDCRSICATDAECDPGFGCEGGYCTNVCDPAVLPTTCPDGWYCQFGICGTGTCVAVPAVPGTLPAGSACTADADCANLSCRALVGGSFCTDPCDPAAPDCLSPLFVCEPVEAGACGFCRCPTTDVGGACASDADCLGGRCVEMAGALRCTRTCDDDTPCGCPAGFECRDLAPDLPLCMAIETVDPVPTETSGCGCSIVS